MIFRSIVCLCFVLLLRIRMISTQGQAAKISRGMDYLHRYGYLPTPDLKSGELQSFEQLDEAIRSMQRFMGITETGEVDADTLAMMEKPRCGVPDIMGTSESARKKRYTLVGYEWGKNDLTYRIISYTPDLSNDDTRRTIRTAFDIWQAVTPLTFTEISRDDSSADINIEFVSGYHGDGGPFDGPGGVLAHAYFPGPDIGGDAHFDDDEYFTILTTDGTNLKQVAAHEFGHSLGLGHSSVNGALMAPYYQGYVADLVLPDDDIMGIQQLYGPNPYEPVEPEMPVITEIPEEPNVPATSGPCDTGYDAISSIRGELFIFKDDKFWRVRQKGTVLSGYPVLNDLFWYELPSSLDAVYERYDNKIMFLKGSQYWEYTANYPDLYSPQYLSSLGLPHNIDAALVWGNNGKTFFFKGKQYWRYDEYNQYVDPGYPRQISTNWKGVPDDIDSAFTWKDGYTYFFKGEYYWKFDSNKMQVESGYPREAAVDWLGCASMEDEQVPTPGTTPDPVADDQDGKSPDVSSTRLYRLSPSMLLTSIIFFFLL